MAAQHADHDHHESDYEIGSMDIEAHRATYSWFGGFVKWGSLAMAVALVFLVMVTSTGAGFFGAAAAAVVLLVLGIVLLRSKPSSDAH
jgi:hypothetical protein